MMKKKRKKKNQSNQHCHLLSLQTSQMKTQKLVKLMLITRSMLIQRSQLEDLNNEDITDKQQILICEFITF